MAEFWLSGPIEGIPDELMPAAHSLMDALEDMERAAAPLTVAELWLRPGGAASVGFHLRHVRGSAERLMAYARGEGLTRDQLAQIPLEGDPGDPRDTAAELLAELRVGVFGVLDEYRATPPSSLPQERLVGRAGLPSTVQGLLFHIADHARRHAGQVVATAKIVAGLGLGDSQGRDEG